MSDNYQYRCPECGAGGAHPKSMKAPLCHKCDYTVTMKQSQNGRILEDDELPFPFIPEKSPVEKDIETPFPSISLPNIRRMTPTSIAEVITSVQSIAPNVGDFISNDFVTETPADEFGDMIHDFISGYMVHDGIDFINIVDFIELYGKDQVKHWNKE